jgi:cell wall assembly regulator SMI1
MKNEKIKEAIVEKFGEPAYIQTQETGSVISQIAYYNPVPEEEMYDSIVVTNGLSLGLPPECEPVEIAIYILSVKEKEEWERFGRKLEGSIKKYLEEKKCIRSGDIAYGFALSFFEKMPNVFVVDYAFLMPEYLLSGVKLIELIPLYKAEADDLAKLNSSLRPKIISLLKGQWSDPERPSMSIIKDAIKKIWVHIETWYQKNTPGLYKELDNGVNKTTIKKLEDAIHITVPDDLAASLMLHNGKMYFHSYQYLTIGMIDETADMMNKLKKEGTFDNYKYKIHNGNKGMIEDTWWSEKWIPFAKDSEGNLICIDTSPGNDGVYGQIIYWEKEEGPLISQFTSFLDWILNYMNLLYNSRLVISKDGFLQE